MANPDPQFDEEILENLNCSSVERRKTYGGTAFSEVMRQLSEVKDH